MENNNAKKCYNSFSCIVSGVIILFVLGSVIFDLVVSKPKTRKSIEEIKIEVQEINHKIDVQSTYYMTKDTMGLQDTINK